MTTTDQPTELHLLSLGIFDDGDVEPAFHLMLIDSPQVTLAQCQDLLEVAETSYGRRPPTHAQFWDCHPGTPT